MQHGLFCSGRIPFYLSKPVVTDRPVKRHPGRFRARRGILFCVAMSRAWHRWPSSGQNGLVVGRQGLFPGFEPGFMAWFLFMFLSLDYDKQKAGWKLWHRMNICRFFNPWFFLQAWPDAYPKCKAVVVEVRHGNDQIWGEGHLCDTKKAAF